ncbi:MAG: cell filamentation protein Fic, partial [Candidatus Bathyarchaeota archaeon]
MKYIDEFILDRINSKKTRLESMVLDKNSLKKILRDILVEFACTSNAIEGSTLSLEETSKIIESGI